MKEESQFHALIGNNKSNGTLRHDIYYTSRSQQIPLFTRFAIIQKIALSLIVISLLVIAGCSPQTKVPDSFAQCLSEKGAIMYGTEWCPHCKNQKALFGSAFQYVNYVDCDLNRDACIKAGVEGFPTWVIDGNNYPGEQPLARLASLSGCELNVVSEESS